MHVKNQEQAKEIVRLKSSKKSIVLKKAVLQHLPEFCLHWGSNEQVVNETILVENLPAFMTYVNQNGWYFKQNLKLCN